MAGIRVAGRESAFGAPAGLEGPRRRGFPLLAGGDGAEMVGEGKSIGARIEELQAGISTEENAHALFEHYYSTVYRFFARKGFSAEDCRDLAQETFLGSTEVSARFAATRVSRPGFSRSPSTCSGNACGTRPRGSGAARR